MWPVPKKYKTQCMLNGSDSIISQHVFEAINKDEAETRAYLNCVNENNKKRNVRVKVERII